MPPFFVCHLPPRFATWLLAGLFSVGLSLVLAAADPADLQAREAWMKGYLKLEDARQAEDAGRAELAVSQYNAALGIFIEVKNSYPEWQPALLSYRIRFCREKIEELRRLASAEVKVLDKSEIVEQNQKYRQEVETLKEEIRRLERELRVTAEAMERARREAARNAAARQETEGLMQENRSLGNKVAIFEKRVEGLQKEIQELKADASQRIRADSIQERLDLAVAANRRLTSELNQSRADSAKADERLREIGLDREKARAETLRLNGELQALTTRLQAAEGRTTAVAEQLAKANEEKAVAKQAADSAEREAAAARQRQQQNQARLAELEAQLRTVEAARRELEARPLVPPEQLASLQQLIQEKDRQLAKLAEDAQAGAGKLAERVADLEQQLRDTNTTRRELEARVATAPEQIAALKQTVDERDRQLAKLAEQAQTVAQQLATTELQATRLQTAHEAQASEVRQLRARLAATENQRGQSGAVIAALTAKLDQANTNLTTLRETVDDYRARLAAIEQDRELVVRRAESRLNLLRQQEQEIRELKEKITVLTDQNLRLQVAAPGAAADPAALQALQERLHAALAEREYHRQRGDEFERAATRAKGEAASLAKQLGERPLPDADQMAALRQELARQETRLAQEQERVRQLEAKAIAKPTPSPPNVAPPVADLVAALLHQGLAAEKEGNIEAATWNYKQVLENAPNQPIALRRLGTLAIQAGDDLEAIRHLNAAFYAAPDDLTTLMQLGFALVRQEQADLGMSMLARAAALNPNDATVHKQLGVACSSLGWRDAAEVQFRRALAIDNNDPDVNFNLALLLSAKTPKPTAEARQLYANARRHGVEPDPQLDAFFGYADQ